MMYEAAIANRILHTYINQFYILPWYDYCVCPLLYHTSRTINQTLKLIYDYSKCEKIVFLVDEFVRLFSEEPDMRKILSKIHYTKDAFLNNGPFKLFTCITTSFNIIEKSIAVSGRANHFYCLPKFDSYRYFAIARKSFLKTLQIQDKKSSNIALDNELLIKLANVCGNYPRAASKCREILFTNNGGSKTLESIVKECVEILKNLYGKIYENTDEEVILHLIGIKIWNIPVEKHLSILTKDKENKLVYKYTKNFLTSNGFIFSNLQIQTYEWIEPSVISPILLATMLISRFEWFYILF